MVKEKSEKRVAFAGILIAVVVTASIPVAAGYTVWGEELTYQMMRIEALGESIGSWELPVRLQSTWLAGHGYGDALFCGNVFLLAPALLRAAGVPMGVAYRIFLVLVNIVTAWISWVSFSKCFQNDYVGVLGCALYTLSPYRLYLLYNQAAVGEYTAMVFLPLLVWGFYRIYTKNPKEKGYGWNWVIPVIGFSGILLSSMLLGVLAGFLVVLLCLILWKKTFRKRTFLVLLGVLAMTVVVNAWFLVPFLDLLGADRYSFIRYADMPIQNKGILAAHLFYTLQAAGNSTEFAGIGMLDTVPAGPGAAVLICLGLWLWVRKRRTGEGVKPERRAGDIGFVLTVLTLFMCTRYFPWDTIGSWNRFLALLVGSMQYPWRMLAIAMALGAFTACAAGAWILREKMVMMQGRTALLLLALVAVVFGNYQVNNILLTRQAVWTTNVQDMRNTASMEMDYLPVGVDTGHFGYHKPVCSYGILLESYGKGGLWMRAQVDVREASFIEFPLLYYKGYQVTAPETGERFLAEKGDNGDVRVYLPAGFHGEINVWYGGMWYWHLAGALSLVAIVGAAVWHTKVRFRK